jgi:hypothetical protein
MHGVITSPRSSCCLTSHRASVTDRVAASESREYRVASLIQSKRSVLYSYRASSSARSNFIDAIDGRA